VSIQSVLKGIGPHRISDNLEQFIKEIQKNSGARKMADLKLADLEMTDQIVRKMGDMKLAELKMADQI